MIAIAFAMSRAYHLKEGITVNSEDELTKLAQRLLDQPFDKNEPLWDMHFVTNTSEYITISHHDMYGYDAGM